MPRCSETVMNLLARSILCVSLGSLVFVAEARAADAPTRPAPPPAPPKPRPMISHPYLDSLVGTWDIVAKPAGRPEERGAARWWKAFNETALLESMSTSSGSFFGFGVLYVRPDGKSIDRWWFDSMGQGEVWHTSGTLAADGWPLSSSDATGTFVNTMKRTADGHAYTMQMGGTTNLEVAYTKSTKEYGRPPIVDALAIKHPLVQASVGDYAMTSVLTLPATAGGRSVTAAGKASNRLGVGGAYLMMEYSLQAPEGPMIGLGVASV